MGICVRVGKPSEACRQAKLFKRSSRLKRHEMLFPKEERGSVLRWMENPKEGEEGEFLDGGGSRGRQIKI